MDFIELEIFRYVWLFIEYHFFKTELTLLSGEYLVELQFCFVSLRSDYLILVRIAFFNIFRIEYGW